MAYFPNGCAGEVFDEQCCRCRYGEKACPIAWVQFTYNYDACNNKTARAILDSLVKQDGTCAMFTMDRETFAERKIKKAEPGEKPGILPVSKSQRKRLAIQRNE